MTLVHRVLPPDPMLSLEEYLARTGGRGLAAAQAADPEAIVAELEASGLRGRGGAGFPTGTKWRTIRENRSPAVPATVVVNGAEGEPGTFKDRTILRLNPYVVIEGALIAALVVGADRIVFALKASFEREVARLKEAVDEFVKQDLASGVTLTVFAGPAEYLYGEETALLEALDGRAPLPRIAPPYRRGADEVVATQADADSESNLSARVEMAAPGDASVAPPTLVDNVETMADVARIVERGAAWFRTVGTEQSPGTIVVTVSGAVARHGVGEVNMGTTLREAIEEIGGGAREGRRIIAVLPGAAAAPLPSSALDTPLTYEDFAAAGSGLGSAGFTVLDDADDPAAVAAGVSRFLAVESCGQCTPCKQDGLALSGLLARVAGGEATESDLDEVRSRVATVADEARCSLATQHQAVVAGFLERFPEAFVPGPRPEPRAPSLVAEIVDIEDGAALLDERHAAKQPDWTYNHTDSGKVPADRLDEHRGGAADAASPAR